MCIRITAPLNICNAPFVSCYKSLYTVPECAYYNIVQERFCFLCDHHIIIIIIITLKLDRILTTHQIIKSTYNKLYVELIYTHVIRCNIEVTYINLES